MQQTWKTSSLMTIVAIIAGIVIFADSSEVEARPKYRTVFQKHYTAVAENNKITCYVCHGKTDGKMDKKKHNAYGMALGKSLEKKNETDEDAIKAALKKAEAEKSGEEGKTFGDLLGDGKLPVAAE